MARLADSPNARLRRTYFSWRGMHWRCGKKYNPSYPYYGGRGIRVCRRWKSFDTFLSDMGLKPDGFTLERINVNGNYRPGNCKWATVEEQNRNKRTTRKFFVDGIALSITQAAKLNGIARNTVHNRLRKGWSLKKSLTTRAATPREKGLSAAASRWGNQA